MHKFHLVFFFVVIVSFILLLHLSYYVKCHIDVINQNPILNCSSSHFRSTDAVYDVFISNFFLFLSEIFFPGKFDVAERFYVLVSFLGIRP